MTQKSNKATAADSRPKSGLEFLKRLAKQQNKYLRRSVFFGLLATLSMIMQWLSLAYMADQLIMHQATLTAVWPTLSLFTIGTLLRPLFIKFKNNLAHTASWQARQQVRQHILQDWRQRSPLSQHQHSPAAAATQWVEEVEAMDGYFSNYWPQQMLAALSPLLIIIPVFWLNWICGVLLLISAPLIPIFMILVGLGAENINQKYFVMRQRLAGHFLDRVKHLSTIKLFNAQQYEADDIALKSDNYRKVIMRTLKVAFLSSTVLEFFTTVAIASVAIYIGFSLFGALTWGPSASLTLFSGFAILLLAPEFFQPLRNLSQYYHDRATALAACNNLLEALNTDKPINELAADSSYSDIEYISHAATLEVKNVSFGYGQPLQRNINFSLQRGEILSLSGPSGSGKSSLLHTLAGYLPALEGHIRIPVDDITQAKVAFLPQQAWLMGDSVLNNIRLFRPNIEQAELDKLLQTVDMLEDIKQRSLGLNSQLDEDGLSFSGGQAQRIALLRLMLAPTPVILLDEPTASLDQHNRQRVITQLQALAKNGILIIATHDQDIINMAHQHLLLSPQTSHSPEPSYE
jgi:ATP-binding cassette, subfamily C, bacterial CydD